MTNSEFRKSLPAGSVVFSQGDPADCAYILESGSIQVSIIRDQQKIVVATLTEGDLLGEMALIDDQHRTASAVTLSDSNLVIIPKNYIKQKIYSSDPTLRLFLQVILERYRDIHARLVQVLDGLGGVSTAPEDSASPDTSNAIKDLVGQYIEMQQRIFEAVSNASHSKQFHGRHEHESKSTTYMLNMEHSLKAAVSNREFELYYQPIISLAQDTVAGCEALIRWNNPELGMVSPLEFIPTAEDTGLIIPIGQWVIEEACSALKRFMAAAQPNSAADFYVSINLSAKQFEQNQLIDNIRSTISSIGIPFNSVKFEITESLLMDNPPLAETALNKLEALGVTLAIDDFGTGYSSFSYLHRFPIHTLKIDRAFVSTMCQNIKSLNIVKSLIQLAHSLSINVIAEGVETEEEMNLLKVFGCDFAQGYYFSRPVPEADFTQLLENDLLSNSA